jgi:hypothetical protein
VLVVRLSFHLGSRFVLVRRNKIAATMGYDEQSKVFVNVRKDKLRDSAGLAHRKILKRDA